jgi:glucuronide carrier protein
VTAVAPRLAVLGMRQYLGYGAGDAANNLTFAMASSFLLIYYTDAAGISAATAGTMFLVVRVWAGIADLLAGRLVERTGTRWGRFRPYLIFGSVPLLVLLVALFSVPGAWSDDTKVVYAYVSYALFSLAYSVVNIPYGSLSAAMTQDPDERAKLSTSRVVFTSVTILMLAIVVAPQIEGSSDLQESLMITTVIFAVVGLVLYLWCFATTSETVERDVAPVALRESVGMVARNRPLLILCLSCLPFLTGMFALQTVAVYYARDVLGNADLFIVLSVVQNAGMIAAAVFVPRAVGTIGKKRSFVVGGTIAAAASVGVAVAPGSTPTVAIVCFAVLGAGIGAVNTLIFALQADTVEYGEWRTGVRGEASAYSVLSFTRKVGQGVGGAAAAYTIWIGGYVSGASAQSDAALTSIRVAAGAIPAVAIATAAVVMLAYPLTEELFRRLVSETAERRAAGHAGGESGRPMATT